MIGDGAAADAGPSFGGIYVVAKRRDCGGGVGWSGDGFLVIVAVIIIIIINIIIHNNTIHIIYYPYQCYPY